MKASVCQYTQEGSKDENDDRTSNACSNRFNAGEKATEEPSDR